MDASVTPAATVTSDQIALAVLRESVSSRAVQARVAFFGTLIAIAAFMPVLLSNVPYGAVALWTLPVICFLLWRLIIARAAAAEVEQADAQRLQRFDWLFRINSLCNQAWIGSGLWTVALSGNTTVHYVVTIAICFFGTGAAASLVSDFKTVLMTLPILYGQAIVFWLLQGMDGLHVAVSLATIMLLTIGFSRRTQQVYSDSIAIRFENDELLAKLAREKGIADQARQQAEAANRSKSKFLAAASHDLRQPLYAVMLLRDTLEMHDLDPPVKEIVEQQGAALGLLAHLFDNLLEVSSLESGSIEVKLETVSTAHLFRELDVEFRPSCEKKGLRLQVDETDVFVSTDVELLLRLLRNLLSNAVRYTEEGRVGLSGRVEGRDFAISITDTGPGIESGDQQRIFQEFVQLGNPGRNRSKGVGLGLAIVRHIVNLLDIELQLESTPGNGTEITIRLPVVEGVRSARRDSQCPPSLPEAGKDYVWVIEDDELVRGALKARLTVLGIRHDFAASRCELESLVTTQGWPDHAILDDMLGGSETGLEIADWLADHLGTSHILMVTGNSEPERLKELDASPYILMRKPVTSEQLIGWLRDVKVG